MDVKTRNWMIDGLGGVVVGGIIGAIVAVNLVIFSGIDRGYEATIPEVFDQSPLIGILTVAILVAGPVLGVLAFRRMRRSRTHQPLTH